MKVMKRFGAAALLLALLSIPAIAHHSFTAEFDQKKPVKFTGKLTLMKWSNPHGWIYVDVKDEATGKVVNWACETTGSNSLLRSGWRKEDLVAGTVLTIEGWQARNGSPTANINSVTLPSGKRLWAGTSNGTPQQ